MSNLVCIILSTKTLFPHLCSINNFVFVQKRCILLQHSFVKELIDKGNYYLVNACSGSNVSKYHLGAGIAYWHTTPDTSKKWTHILQLYNQLIVLEYSSVTALNRTFAYGKVYGNEAGIKEAEKLGLSDNCYFYSLLGYLYSKINCDKSIEHYIKAIELSKSPLEKRTLKKEIDKLKIT